MHPNRPRAWALWLVSMESIGEPFQSIGELHLVVESGLFLRGIHFKNPLIPSPVIPNSIPQLEPKLHSISLAPSLGSSKLPYSVVSQMLTFSRSGSPPDSWNHPRSPDRSLEAPLGLLWMSHGSSNRRRFSRSRASCPSSRDIGPWFRGAAVSTGSDSPVASHKGHILALNLLLQTQCIQQLRLSVSSGVRSAYKCLITRSLYVGNWQWSYEGGLSLPGAFRAD